MKDQETRMIFLNQVSGRLFLELAEGLAQFVGKSVLYTIPDKLFQVKNSSNLMIVKSPEYRRGSSYRRLLDWITYFFFVLVRVFKQSNTASLFIVSNPPFLPLVGYIMKKVRGQSYVVLVYDIYPDLAIRLGKLSPNGPITRLWRWFNITMWENSDAVITIGEYMAARLETMFNVSRTCVGRTIVIPNWVDPEFIKPLPKQTNWFARQYGLVDKLTIQYSGNLGATHDIETILEAAKRLAPFEDIKFLIIGDGFKRHLVEKSIKTGVLNLMLLPFQPEEVLPYSLTASDVTIVTLAKGIEGLSVPSKVYYAMASGSALLCICSGDNELQAIVHEYECGLIVEPGNVEGLIKAIQTFIHNKEFLRQCQKNARKAAETCFDKNSSIEKYRQLFIEIKCRKN